LRGGADVRRQDSKVALAFQPPSQSILFAFKSLDVRRQLFLPAQI